VIVPPPPPRLEDLPRGTRLVAGLGYATIVPDLDFETYSEAGYVWDGQKWAGPPGAAGNTKGLPVVGAAIYSAHPTCEVLCAAYDLKDGIGRRRWRPGLPDPVDLFAYLATGGVIEAVNVGFERWIWENVCVPRMDWPPVHPSQWRCVAAKARAFSLPGSLAKMGEVLKLDVQKDKEGTRLINKFCMPRKPTKGDPRRRIRMRYAPLNLDDLRAGADAGQVAEDYADTCAMLSYNETDIVSEAEASSRIPDLEGEELAWWQVDQAINKRGVHIDLASVENCIAVIEQAHAKYNAELFDLCGVDAASKVQQLLGWLHGQGVHLDSLDEDAVDAALKREGLPPAARRVLEIRAAVGSASVKKVFAMRNRATAASRMHDLFIYYGARTGRATGEGPQPTNSPKAGPDLVRCGCKRHYQPALSSCPWCGVPRAPSARVVEWSPDAAEDAIEVLRSRSLQLLEHVFGDAMHAIAGCIRGLYDAAPGHDLISTDYNSIEAVGLAMISGEKWRIEVFRTHGKIYEASAATMFGVPFEDFAKHKAETQQHHPLRQKGKIGELAFGYQGWLGAARAFEMPGTDAEIQKDILAWRAASPAVERLWGGQTLGRAFSIAQNAVRPEYTGEVGVEAQAALSARDGRWDRTPHYFGVEGMAISAILDPGTEYPVKRLDGTDAGVAFLMRGKTLYCRLPSGRWLTYHDARVEPSERGLSISYWGNNTNPKNGPVGWIEIRTWGGRLVENINQAACRDILRFACINLEQRGYPVVLHVYDEIVSEIPEGFGSVEEFEAIVTVPPFWARDWPIRAPGGWRAKRYRKG
jgi:DNA polymerase